MYIGDDGLDSALRTHYLTATLRQNENIILPSRLLSDEHIGGWVWLMLSGILRAFPDVGYNASAHLHSDITAAW